MAQEREWTLVRYALLLQFSPHYSRKTFKKKKKKIKCRKNSEKLPFSKMANNPGPNPVFM